jgi:hypothetical protein
MSNIPANVQPGDFGLVPMGGQVGKAIRVLQWMDGSGFANYEHAFLYVGNGEIVEATPNGAIHVPYHYGNNVFWSSGKLSIPLIERANIVDAGIGYVGTPYSFLDYASLVACRIHVPGNLLDDYIKSTNHMICSQLVARCYYDGDFPLFKCWTGDVTPGDLYDRLTGKPIKP